MRLHPLSLPICASLLAVASVAIACSCLESIPEESFPRADVVFSGTVGGYAQGENGMNIYTLSVDTTWKGSVGTTVSVRSHESSATCGIALEKGVRYVVLARYREDGTLYTGLCDGTARYADSSDMLEYLATVDVESGPSCAPQACEDGTFRRTCDRGGIPLNYIQDPCKAKETPFSDVPLGHPQAKAVSYVYAANVVQGYPDGTFRPENLILRSEFAKMIAETSQIPERIDSCLDNFGMSFGDVPYTSWYAKYVCTLVAQGSVRGYPDGSFRPATPISFVEAAKILASARGLVDSAECDGSCNTADHPWYEAPVRALDARRATPRSVDRFDHLLTRGELAEMLLRLDAGRGDEPFWSYDSLETFRVCDERIRAGHETCE